MGSGSLHSLRRPIIDTDANTIKLVGHGLKTGDAISYDSGQGTAISIQGGTLTKGQIYYAVFVDADTIKLASTYENAVATTPTTLDLTGTGTGNNHSFQPSTVILSSNIINIGSHNYSTGDAVIYNNGGGTNISGLNSGTTYYIVKVDARNIQLAETLNNAKKSTPVVINFKSIGTGTNHRFSDANANLAGDLGEVIVNNNSTVTVNAKNTGEIFTASLAGAFATGRSQLETAEPESSDDSPDAPTGGKGISGNVSINTIDDTAEAFIRNATVKATNSNINITSANDSQIFAIAGAVSIGYSPEPELDTVAIAGAFARNSITGKTKAYIDQSLIEGKTLNQTVTNDSDIIALTAGSAGAFSDRGYALAGSLNFNIIDNENLAYISNDSIIHLTGNATIAAKDESFIVGAAGTLSYGGRVGAGASVTDNKISNRTEAYLENSQFVSGNLDLNAINDSDIIGIAASAGISKGGMAANLSIVSNKIDNQTKTFITGQEETAIDLTKISSNAITFSQKHTFKTGDAIVYQQGTDTNNISGLVHGNTYYVIVDPNDEKKIKLASSLNNATAGTALTISQGSATTTNHKFIWGYDVKGNATIKSQDNANIKALAGTVGITISSSEGNGGGSLLRSSIGISVAVNEINNTTTSIINNAAFLASGDVNIEAKMNADIYALSISGALAANTNTSVSQGSSNPLTITGAGAGTGNIIRNITQAKIENKSITTANILNLKVEDTSKINADIGGAAISLSNGSGSGGNSAGQYSVAVGVAIAQNTINNNLQAVISNSTVDAKNNLSVISNSNAEIEALALSLAVAASNPFSGGSGESISVSGAGAGTYNQIDNIVESTITNSAVKVGGNLTINATDNSKITADAGGGSINIAAGTNAIATGVGAAVAENEIGKKGHRVSALIDNSKVAVTGTTTINSNFTGKIDALAISAALSGSKGTGTSASLSGAGSATYNKIRVTTEAQVKNNSRLTTTSLTMNAVDSSTILGDAGGLSVAFALGNDVRQ